MGLISPTRLRVPFAFAGRAEHQQRLTAGKFTQLIVSVGKSVDAFQRNCAVGTFWLVINKPDALGIIFSVEFGSPFFLIIRVEEKHLVSGNAG